MTVVADASVIVDVLRGQVSRAGLDALDGDVVAPELMCIEVAAALGKLCRRGLLTDVDAVLLIDTLHALPIETLPVRDLVGRAFEFRDRVSVYDACYVALAEAEGAVIVTTDGRLGRAHDLPVDVVVV